MKPKNQSETSAMVHPKQDNDSLQALGVSLCAILDTTKPRKDKSYAVKLRIIQHREKYLIGIGLHCNTDEWREITSLGAKGRPRNQQSICLDALLKASKIIIKAGRYDHREFRSTFKSIQTDKTNVWSAFDEQIRILTEAGRISYAATYSDAKNSFNKFMADLSRYQVNSFNQITCKWLEAYQKWAETETKTKRALSRSTIGMYTRNMKVLVNQAIKTGNATKNPFLDFNIPSSENIKRALSPSEIESIMKYESKNEFRELYRDLFTFSYQACGMNFADILRLKWHNIKTYPSQSGERKEYISFQRKKTSRKVKGGEKSVLISKAMKAIIDRWGNQRISDNTYIFKPLTRALDEADRVRITKQEVKAANMHLKAIAKDLDFEDSISTYAARHSWATHAIQSGHNIYFVQDRLGHQDPKTTMAYVKSLGPELLEDSMKFVVGFS